jgi:hypothetical protein
VRRIGIHLIALALLFVLPTPAETAHAEAMKHKAQHDYHDAFAAPDGTRQDQATAPEYLGGLSCR